MTDVLDRLRRASPDRFAATVEAALAATYGQWSIEASPPSPAGGIDLVLERDAPAESTQLLHVRQYGADEAVDTATVRELATMRDRLDADRAAVLTTGTVTDAAGELAAAEDVEILESDALVELVRAADVELPGGEPPDPAGIAERFVREWPERTRQRAVALVRTIDERGAFAYRVRRADESTELEFVPAGEETALLKMRFTETSLLVFVRDGDRYRRAVATSVDRERPPDVAQLERRIDRALDRIDGDR